MLRGVVVMLATAGSATAVAGSPSRLSDVDKWAYQLQGPGGTKLDLERLARCDCNLLVIDYADHGKAFTRKQLDALRKTPDGRRRRLIAYLSVGEAENYRFYWRDEWKNKPPAFMAAENRAWAGNYKVRYWDPAWRAIVLAYLDRIIDAEFDGVYLDIIDAYEYFGHAGAPAQMAGLVEAIAHHARVERGKPAFAVIPQNGAAILDALDAEGAAAYLDTIDAIGAEDTFFYGEKKEDNRLAIQIDTLAALTRFKKAGKPVLAVDYLTDPTKAKKFVSLANEHGFKPYVGRRALDRLVAQPK